MIDLSPSNVPNRNYVIFLSAKCMYDALTKNKDYTKEIKTKCLAWRMEKLTGNISICICFNNQKQNRGTLEYLIYLKQFVWLLVLWWCQSDRTWDLLHMKCKAKPPVLKGIVNTSRLIYIFVGTESIRYLIDWPMTSRIQGILRLQMNWCDVKI